MVLRLIWSAGHGVESLHSETEAGRWSVPGQPELFSKDPISNKPTTKRTNKKVDLEKQTWEKKQGKNLKTIILNKGMDRVGENICQLYIRQRTDNQNIQGT
jgi:hypothetical protein